MRVFIYVNGRLVGDIEKAECGGWFAYTLNGSESNETFWSRKKDAIKHLKGGAR
ncbi:MAG: hypothetical protein SFU91_13085 [Chloroherpetonaceae bacterium]|nr:hypothetical protein [Chloroherpetonaceae bacterium]